jgi:UDP-N-acetylglucosamine 2-epimerase
MLIDLIAGARPNFMKIAPIIEAINEATATGEDIAFRLIHTVRFSVLYFYNNSIRVFGVYCRGLALLVTF